MKPSTAPDVESDIKPGLEPTSTPAHGSELESEEPALEQEQTTTDEIPPTMEFPNDPDGYKETIYEILYEAAKTDKPPLTSEGIKDEIIKRITDGDFNSPPPTSPQVTGNLNQIEKALIKHGLSIVTRDKKQKGHSKAGLYKLHRIDENVHILDKKPAEKEDTEINKVDYIETIKNSFGRIEYAVIREIARKPGMTFEDLSDIISDGEKLHDTLSRLNIIGSSSALPQRFKIERTNRKYYLIVFKPHKQEKKVPPYQPKIIPELMTAETKTVFGIRKTVQAIINRVLSEAKIMENTSRRWKTEVDTLRAKKQASLLIASKVKDIIKTLETIISQKPETERIAGQIRDSLREIIEKYEKLQMEEFPAILRAELRRV